MNPTTRWRLLALAIAMTACLSCPATAARRHFGAMHLRGSVVAVSPNFIDINVSGRHCCVPTVLRPTCAVGGSNVAYGALTVGESCLMTVPAYDAEIVGLAPGWVTLAEPNGVLLTVPVGEVPSLTGMQVQLVGPSDNIVTDSVALGLTLLGQGYSVLVPEPTIAYEPDYIDCGPCVLDGTIQGIYPNYCAVNYNGALLDVPLVGSNFYFNGTSIPARSLRVGRHVRVHDPALVGTVASMQSNRVALRTSAGRTVNVPLSGTVARSLPQRVPAFARQSNGRVLAAPMAHTATFSHLHAQLLSPTAAGAAHAMLPHRGAQLHPTGTPNLRANRPVVTPRATSHLAPHQAPMHTTARPAQPHLMPHQAPMHTTARPAQPHLMPHQAPMHTTARPAQPHLMPHQAPMHTTAR
ncbi:MAG TPA: hypothetical protein VGO93_09355, partial [Candidatus Xenobia bacterium]